jgi:hypothetical protein
MVDQTPIHMIGSVDECATPTPELHEVSRRVIDRHFEAAGVPQAASVACHRGHAVQTGLLVLAPSQHRSLLERICDSHAGSEDSLYCAEDAFSSKLLETGCVHWLDPRFNYGWTEYTSLHFPFLLDDPDHPRLSECVTRALGAVYGLRLSDSFPEPPTIDASVLPRRESPREEPPFLGAAAAPLSTPVALFLFARPDTTRRVFETIRQARPARLYLVADGPRTDRPEETERSRAARAICAHIDWPCDVRVNFSDANLGQKRRLETGLRWVFEHTDEAIILEDDCVPDPTFFPFCQDLLDRYRDEPQVLAITGSNFQYGLRPGHASYFFSRYPLIWGWSTWRRAWRLYDDAMSRWPAAREGPWLSDLLGDGDAVRYWSYVFDTAHRSGGSWDYAWTFACWQHGGLVASPRTNLVSNIGFGPEATHTRQHQCSYASLLTEPLESPLRHPARIQRDVEADAFTEDIVFSGNLRRMLDRVRARVGAGPPAPGTT